MYNRSVNKVYEIDVDTEREVPVQVRYVLNVPGRRSVEDKFDIEDDIFSLTYALLAAIRHCDNVGPYPSYTAMEKVVAMLQEGFVDTSIKAQEIQDLDRIVGNT